MVQDIASRLNERVRIEQPVHVPDELGGAQLSWSELATVWAEILPLSGTAREAAHSAQMQASAGYRVRMRLRGDLRASMRLVWNARVLLIHSLHEADQLLDILTYEEGL